MGQVAGIQHICVGEHVVARPVLGEMVLLDLATDQYFALNEVGTRMWDLLSAGQTVDGASGSLLDEYDVAPDVLQADISLFLSRILDLGFATDCSAK
jgi:hypothetical protein